MNDPWHRWLFLGQLAATLYMTGLIWFVQIVHYPLFGGVGRAVFAAYEQRHSALTTWVVAPPMLVELAAALILLWLRPPQLSLPLLWASAALLAVIWLSTYLIQVPCHSRLVAGYDESIHRWLVVSNWIRTAAWTARAALLLGIVDRLIGR
ncbi:MAG: hypothetical protein RLY70_2492 [Planctomycetota bacterium]|jgi:uncharacterized membrane protein